MKRGSYNPTNKNKAYYALRQVLGYFLCCDSKRLCYSLQVANICQRKNKNFKEGVIFSVAYRFSYKPYLDLLELHGIRGSYGFGSLRDPFLHFYIRFGLCSQQFCVNTKKWKHKNLKFYRKRNDIIYINVAETSFSSWLIIDFW